MSLTQLDSFVLIRIKTIITVFIIDNLCCLTLPSRDFSFILGTSTAIRFVWKLKWGTDVRRSHIHWTVTSIKLWKKERIGFRWQIYLCTLTSIKVTAPKEKNLQPSVESNLHFHTATHHSWTQIQFLTSRGNTYNIISQENR